MRLMQNNQAKGIALLFGIRQFVKTMNPTRQLRLGAALCVLCFVEIGCEKKEPLYEFANSSGSLYRLNRQTGEMLSIEKDTFTKVEQSPSPPVAKGFVLDPNPPKPRYIRNWPADTNFFGVVNVRTTYRNKMLLAQIEVTEPTLTMRTQYTNTLGLGSFYVKCMDEDGFEILSVPVPFHEFTSIVPFPEFSMVPKANESDTPFVSLIKTVQAECPLDTYLDIRQVSTQWRTAKQAAK